MQSYLSKFKKTAFAALFSFGAMNASVSADQLDIGILLPSPIADAVSYTHLTLPTKA